MEIGLIPLDIQHEVAFSQPHLLGGLGNAVSP